MKCPKCNKKIEGKFLPDEPVECPHCGFTETDGLNNEERAERIRFLTNEEPDALPFGAT
jgi:hypothetical protein